MAYRDSRRNYHHLVRCCCYRFFRYIVRLNLFNHVLALFHVKLLVFQQLVILYLGGIYVRVVYERV